MEEQFWWTEKKFKDFSHKLSTDTRLTNEARIQLFTAAVEWSISVVNASNLSDNQKWIFIDRINEILETQKASWSN